jgi:hypothetical protein
MPLNWNPALNDLIGRLAKLYPERDKARLAVMRASLNPDKIDFTGSPEVFWLRITGEANRRDKVLELLKVAQEDFDNVDFSDLERRLREPPHPGKTMPLLRSEHGRFPRWVVLLIIASVLCVLGSLMGFLIYKEHYQRDPSDLLTGVRWRRMELHHPDPIAGRIVQYRLVAEQIEKLVAATDEDDNNNERYSVWLGEIRPLPGGVSSLQLQVASREVAGIKGNKSTPKLVCVAVVRRGGFVRIEGLTEGTGRPDTIPQATKILTLRELQRDDVIDVLVGVVFDHSSTLDRYRHSDFATTVVSLNQLRENRQ